MVRKVKVWQTTFDELRTQALIGAIPDFYSETPTITHGDYVDDAGTIGGPIALWDDADIRVTGGVAAVSPGGYPNTLLGEIGQTHYALDTQGGQRGEFTFKVNGPSFEIAHKNVSGSVWRILINGQYDPNGVQTAWSNNGSFSWTKYVFASGAATRTITIEASFKFYGVIPGTGYVVTAPDALDSDLRSITLTDSFGEGSGTTSPQNSWAAKCAHLLGIRNNYLSAVGGAGWINDGSYISLSDRFTLDAITQSGDVYFIATGYNDINGGNDAPVANVAREKVLALRAANPSCLIFVIGPWDIAAPSAADANYAAIKTAMMRATVGISGCWFVDMEGVDFVAVGGGDIHPTTLGHWMLATAVANKIKDILQAGYDIPIDGQIKPAGNYEIDWANPLTEDLEFYAFDTGSAVVELVHNYTPSLVGTGSDPTDNVSTAFGVAQTYGGKGTQFTLASAPSTSIMTFACALFTSEDNSQFEGSVAYYDTVGGNAYLDAEFYTNPHSSKVSCYGGVAGATLFGQLFNGGALGVSDTRDTFISLAYTANATQRIYGNGQFSNSIAVNQNMLNSSVKVCMGDYVDGSADAFTNGSVYYSAVWSRVLSDGEILQLHRNPYCFLRAA